MPRAQFQSDVSEVSLTVTAVSDKLGVSASTLRTWERRYGLGPGDRRAGSRRRYLPEDVARISRMIDLIRSGVSTSDAAATVKAGHQIDGKRFLQAHSPESPEQLIDILRTKNPELVSASMQAAITQHGLVHAWSRLIYPTLDILTEETDGEMPGQSAVSLLAECFLSVLREIVENRGEDSSNQDSSAPAVTLITDWAHHIAGQVIGVALSWYGLNVRIVLTKPSSQASNRERIERHIIKYPPNFIIVMGKGAHWESLLSMLLDKYQLSTILVGSDTPEIHRDNLLRVRTLAACVEEVVAQFRPGAQALMN